MASHSIGANLVDPQQVLLTGMVQNFGITPILNYVDKNLQLVRNIEILDKSLANLRMQLVYYCKINISNSLINDIKTKNPRKKLQYINVTVRFLILLFLTKGLSSRSEISLSPTTL